MPETTQRISRMKKFAIAAVVAAVGLSTVAMAQYNKPTGLSLRGGLFFPSSASAKEEGKTWFGVGLDYKIKDVSFRRSTDGYDTFNTLSIDFYGKGDHTNVPVMFNQVSRRDKFYWSAGAGLGFARTPNGAGTDTNTEFCYQLSVGMDFEQGETPFFLEGRYFGSAESKLNGFGVFAGIRF